MLSEILSTLSAGIFAGAAIYINLVEHPARMECGPELAVPEFGSSYRRGALFMGTLLMSGVSSASAAWLICENWLWLVGACFLLALIPLTLVFIFPINKRLLDASLERGSDTAVKLMTLWGRWHLVRSLSGLTAFLIFLLLLVGGSTK